MAKLAVESVRLEKISPNAWNPNEMSDFMRAKTRISLLTYGFVMPIVVRNLNGENEMDYEIVDGEHRYTEFMSFHDRPEQMTDREKELLVENIDLQVLLDNGEIPIINAGDLDDGAARELTIILNNLTGEPDTIKLSELIAGLNETVGRERIEEVLPYNPDDLDNLIALLNWDWEQYESDDEDDEIEEEDEWVTWNMTFPKAAMDVIDSEFDRIGDILQLKPNLKEDVKRGLILEKICVLSADTPTESLE